MGAMAEAFVAYAQPLIDETDGSLEQMNKAMTIAQLCYNFALLPAHERETSLQELRPSIPMGDEEFEVFRSTILNPMIRRHEEMFPFLHRRGAGESLLSQAGLSPRTQESGERSAEAFPGTDRYAPCPCGSGEKYKFCCGKKRR